ncbi:EAL domain-containing protein [Pseudogemmatithrix spongiicola]|uniref:EAL domain-containing protein n=1 Tax=Pseudogemmatithrix spongiicola TaxID=3062599 RepID=A0AA49JY91_9BACT|nr:EAL domain-containing protein [Gemmatimonadaceae bacterium 'strain 138']WKW14410.1 EAL domain-containing protein [Gemmatimonadaceae bacterium 'strain 318']
MPALPSPPPALSCRACRDGAGLDFAITMAFQPIVDVEAKTVFAHEALVRGLHGEGAADVLAKVNDHNRYRFDQAARVAAISVAAELQLSTPVSINFLPNAVYRPETCIRVTLEAAAELGFPTSQIIFEVNEAEPIGDRAHLKGIFAEYKRKGFKTAIDDFGAGYAGLALLADFEPDLIKLDMALIRNIHQDRTRRAIIAGTLQTCASLDITVIAEGVETDDEVAVLRDMGVRLFQGYRFGRPATRAIPEPTW